jgi:hypothetical protein
MTTAPQVITIFRSLAAKRFALFFGTIEQRMIIHVAFAEALHQLRQGVPMNHWEEQELAGGTSEEMAVAARIVEQFRKSNLRIVANMNLAAAAAAAARARNRAEI